ncbi:MAG: SurA N-terminal domain-containing protein [Candidatus Paceibacterota bacterium]|jgi:hypothetical protein
MENDKIIEEKKPIAAETQAPVEEKKKCAWKCPKFKMGTGKAIGIAAVIIALALAFYCRGFFIAATVDGSPIGRFAVISEADKQAGNAILDNLITKKVVKSEVARKRITVSDEEIAAEIAKIEKIVAEQGMTLEKALSDQGLTRAELIEQITLQKKVEKLLPSRPTVTDQEVKDYVSANKISIPKENEKEYFAEIKLQMEQQRLNDAINSLVASLKEKAKTQYFGNYKPVVQ